jgi:glycosyltransferase involved in cell wall biosynthesis
LGLKSSKKRLYIALAKRLGVYRRITWQASSAVEAEDIRRIMGVSAGSIVIAPNLLPFASQMLHDSASDNLPERAPGPLRIVFLSRISPMKNLDYLIKLLQRITSPVVFNIFGPAEDDGYWANCRQLLGGLPPNVTADYCGAVASAQVPAIFAQHDLCGRPTRGENFGHVIFESLNAGTPVLLSDRTPWQADAQGALEVLPLDDPEPWVRAIERRCGADPATLSGWRRAALAYARAQVGSNQALAMNRRLFESAIERATS